MANTPTPRSFQSILGAMIDTFRSKTGLGTLRVGGPILSILEAAAQSDVRATQDIFGLLDSLSLDRAEGEALARIGADEGLRQRGALSASGLVDISDKSFRKVSTTVYGGTAAPSSGSFMIDIASGAGFPASGAVYIGRGTSASEGPIPYTSIIPKGSYATLVLSGTTRLPHTSQDTVILAQGGTRVVRSGATMASAAPNRATFATVSDAVLLDGEDRIEGVRVVAQAPGESGNVQARAIREFTNDPFPGAAVVNPLPFSNGREIESPEEFRERIRLFKQTKQKGTNAALREASLGVSSGSRRVASASVISTPSAGTTLYIDDGSAYEESTVGVPSETLAAYALGGEDLFKLSGVPVAKAFALSTVPPPWNIAPGTTLRVQVGDDIAEHVFPAGDFVNNRGATAYEVAASINAVALPFSARTTSGGQGISLFARYTDDAVTVLPTGTALDANKVFEFPVSKNETLHLFKNEKKLNYREVIAQVRSLPMSEWREQTSFTITVDVDQTGPVTYAIGPGDFAGTPFTTPSVFNGPEGWASALNKRIPGIVAKVETDRLVIQSARGSKGSILLSGGTIVAGMFPEGTSTHLVRGVPSDFSLDYATGYLSLAKPLEPGDVLSVGSEGSTAYLESTSLKGGLLTSQDSHLYFVLDAEPTIIQPVPKNRAVQVLKTGGRASYQSASSFVGVKVGDWLVVTDPLMNTHGAWRIDTVTDSFVVVESPSTPAQGYTFLQDGGLYIVKNVSSVQTVLIPEGAYALSSLAPLGSQLEGGGFAVWNNETLLAYTNTSGAKGRITLVATDGEGARLGFPTMTTATDLSGNEAFVRAASTGTAPLFGTATITGTTVTAANVSSLSSSGVLLRSTMTANNEPLVRESKTTIRMPPHVEAFPVASRLYEVFGYTMGPRDTLSLTTGETSYSVPLFRNVTSLDAAYTNTITLGDSDSGSTLPLAFGEGFDFKDFALHFAARTVTHASDSTRKVVWRFSRMGPDGNGNTIAYDYPNGPDADTAVELGSDPRNILVKLPSGPKRSATIPANSLWNIDVTGSGTYQTATLKYFNSVITRIRRVSGTVTINVTDSFTALPGDLVWLDLEDLGGAFTSGVKMITATSVELKSISFSEPGANADFSSPTSIGRARFSSNLPDLAAVAVQDIVALKGIGLSGRFLVRSVNSAGVNPSVSFRVTSASSFPFRAKADTISFFPIRTADSTVTKLVNAVNDLGAPMTGTLESTGTGTIFRSSLDEFFDGAAASSFKFTDGVNWVKSFDPTASKVVLKDPFDLTGTINFLNEKMRLVPSTPKNLADWLNSPATSGLFLTGKADITERGNSIQVTSTARGSLASVRVGGGSANSATAAVLGNQGLTLTIPGDQSDGFTGNMPVLVKNSVPHTIRTIGTNTTERITIVREGDDSKFTSTGALRISRWTSGSVPWRVIKQGAFARYEVVSGTINVTPGDRVSTSITFPAENRGTFRVLASDTTGFWVENPAAINQQTTASITAYSPSQVFPGDLLVISSSALGPNNAGIWRVKQSEVSLGNNTVLIEGAMEEVADIPIEPSLGVTFSVGAPDYTYSVVQTITPGPNETAILTFAPNTRIGTFPVTETSGTQVHALGKLGFDVTLHQGLDGYHYVDGLVGEISRVIHGDEKDPVSYPGVAAAGHSVKITGPLTKRITLSFLLRLESDRLATEAISDARSIITSTVNQHGVGESIALSDLVAVASKVRGVQAVTVLYPEYTSGKDMILVQPHEKAIIMVPEKDITIKVVGA